MLVCVSVNPICATNKELNPILINIKNNLKYGRGTILAPAFILLCKILTLKIIFEFFYKTKVALNYEKIKVS